MWVCLPTETAATKHTTTAMSVEEPFGMSKKKLDSFNVLVQIYDQVC